MDPEKDETQDTTVAVPKDDQPTPVVFPELSPEDLAEQTPLESKYTFWFMKRTSGNKAESYEKSIKSIGTFETIEGFWRVYKHLIRPNDLSTTTDYHLFKTGIKPMWEDDANRKGGKWMIRLKKGIASRYWEELLLAIIGEQFDIGNEICGAVISIRFNEDILSIWNRNADNEEATYKIRDTLREILQLPNFISLEYKRHDASLSDNSSFRNTVVWRSSNRNNSSGGGSNANHSGRSRTPGNKDRGHRGSRGNTGSWQRDATPKEERRSSRRRDTQETEDGWQRQR